MTLALLATSVRYISMKSFILTLLLILAMGPAYAQNVFSGPGANSCAIFMDLYENEPEIYEAVFFAWAKGFMSGMNAMAVRSGEEIFDLVPVDYGDAIQRQFLISYCDANRLFPYVQGVLDLSAELRRRGGN